tara:strand:- start:8 stop:838 length:831 start_codon:yes stop_codon:yes gene_type:complete
MKIGVIVPTRGDRPQFIQQCHKLIARQTRKPDHIFVMDYQPESGQKDIVQRIRRGVEKATKAGCSVAILWEDDDWYHPTYIEWLLKEWEKAKKPAVFGVGETYYYNLASKGRLYMKHHGRTSTFCTMLRLPFTLGWCADHYPYLDMHLHKTAGVKTVQFPPNQLKAIGIKHGIGMVGGGGHGARFKWDMVGTQAWNWFKTHMDDQLSFYENIAKSIPTVKATKVVKKIGRGSITQGIVPQRKNSNGSRITRKETSGTGPNTQLRRRGHTIIKVRRK